ncbi:MAG TPA: hypothetical protein VJG31_01840 [Candidatus Nanoarchaeia archaeon]|nr:hypothetical protein [Candidatus Nanoarchaeia archaeon]
MDTTTVVVVGALVLALIFFGFTMLNANNANSNYGAGNAYSNYPSGKLPSGQIAGGGCGR